MIREIYVDMDGVLSNFEKRYEELYHKQPEIDFPSKNKKKKEYYNNWEEFVAGNNFLTLDPMPDFMIGFKFLQSISRRGIPVKILSSAANEKYQRQLTKEKTQWLMHHNINYEPIIVPGKRFKRMYAKPGYVLVDDTLANVQDWHLAGGIGVQHKSWHDTINRLKPLL